MHLKLHARQEQVVLVQKLERLLTTSCWYQTNDSSVRFPYLGAYSLSPAFSGFQEFLGAGQFLCDGEWR